MLFALVGDFGAMPSEVKGFWFLFSSRENTGNDSNWLATESICGLQFFWLCRNTYALGATVQRSSCDMAYRE